MKFWPAVFLAAFLLSCKDDKTPAAAEPSTPTPFDAGPPSPDWTLAGKLSAVREIHTSSLLPDGTVLIAGGDSTAGAVLATADLRTSATTSRHYAHGPLLHALASP
jgi:hypothetical protein